jgi:hypothetical protein
MSDLKKIADEGFWKFFMFSMDFHDRCKELRDLSVSRDALESARATYDLLLEEQIVRQDFIETTLPLMKEYYASIGQENGHYSILSTLQPSFDQNDEAFGRVLSLLEDNREERYFH